MIFDVYVVIAAFASGVSMILLRLFMVERLKVKGAWEAMGMPRAFSIPTCLPSARFSQCTQGLID